MTRKSGHHRSTLWKGERASVHKRGRTHSRSNKYRPCPAELPLVRVPALLHGIGEEDIPIRMASISEGTM